MAPPTIHSSQHLYSSSAGRRKAEKPPTELISKVKYNNTLPDIPFDPKFLLYPFGAGRFVQYKPTSLEKNFKFDLLTEPDLGVKIDLINPETYAGPPESESIHHDPTDEKLLEDEVAYAPESKRSAQHSKVVPWLRKTEYIATEFNRYGVASERHETKVGYNVKKRLNPETFYKDRESQIQAIDKSFDLAKQSINEHYSKPGVYAIQELPVMPDFELWKMACAQVMFDADPIPMGGSSAGVTHALIRGMMDESGEQFVAYFLPSDETLEKRKQDVVKGVDYNPEELYDYKLAREYNWNVKNKASKGYEENYFLVFRNDGVYYNELETRVRLNKRRHREGAPRISNSRLVVQHRPLNDQEQAAQEVRLLALQPEAELEEVLEEVGEEADKAEDEEEKNDADEDEEEGGEAEKSDKAGDEAGSEKDENEPNEDNEAAAGSSNDENDEEEKKAQSDDNESDSEAEKTPVDSGGASSPEGSPENNSGDQDSEPEGAGASSRAPVRPPPKKRKSAAQVTLSSDSE